MFETVAVRAGEPVRLSAHIDRLAASVRTLYGVELDPNVLRDHVAAAVVAAGPARARLRLGFRPPGEITAATVPATPHQAAPVPLSRLIVPGGLGAHKWRDRALLDTTATPLICDLDGSVLEAGWANVWALERGTLVTPPADGRLLPGITRAALLADPAVPTAEEPLDGARLAAAEAIILTASVRLAVEADATTPAGQAAVRHVRARLGDAG